MEKIFIKFLKENNAFGLFLQNFRTYAFKPNVSLKSYLKKTEHIDYFVNSFSWSKANGNIDWNKLHTLWNIKVEKEEDY